MTRTATSIPKAASSAEAGPVAKLPDTLGIDPQGFLENFPGPALIVDPSFRVVAANDSAKPLGPRIEAERLREGIRTALESGCPRIESLESGTRPGAALLQTAVLPATAPDGGAYAIILGHEDLLSRSFQDALIDSRQRYKDLVECSSDFAWETNADRQFVFVSPRGGLGYSAADLIGRKPEDLYRIRSDGSSPFACHERIEDIEVWVEDAAGELRCLLISATPLVDRNGSRAGTRGVWRDVTEERRREAALAEARRHERSLSDVVRAIHGELDHQGMLTSAAAASARALGAAFCLILRKSGDGPFVPASQYPAEFGGMESFHQALLAGAVRLEQAGRIVTYEDVVCVPTHYASAINGALCFGQDPARRPWDDDDRRLMVDIADQLGIAIEQSMAHERLKAMSRTDDLTGVLNRRAFLEEAERRLHHARRYAHPLAILYLDLNNFKAVNDTLGHRRGDEILVELAGLVRSSIRKSDLAARVGGDEFIVLLEETETEGALAKAHHIAEAVRALSESLGPSDKPLGLTIGVALLEPGSETTLDDLMESADAAMYAAKAKSGVNYVLAGHPD